MKDGQRISAAHHSFSDTLKSASIDVFFYMKSVNGKLRNSGAAGADQGGFYG
jgi:hypothetical protein